MSKNIVFILINKMTVEDPVLGKKKHSAHSTTVGHRYGYCLSMFEYQSLELLDLYAGVFEQPTKLCAACAIIAGHNRVSGHLLKKPDSVNVSEK